MLKLIALVVVAAWALFALNVSRRLRKHIAQAKATGLPYQVVPWHPAGGAWFLVNDVVIRTLAKFDFASKWTWVHLLNRELSWRFLRETEEKYGDTFLTVSPVQILLRTSNAELGTQITARRNDFIKLVDRFRVVDMFGKSILTTEGQEWKRHKKVTAPSFSEKSNRLVFEESLRQAEGMINYWSSQGSNTIKDIKIDDASTDAATLSFHVICAAGFGVPQLWPGETEEKLQGNGIPGFSYVLPGGRHKISLKESLGGVLNRIFWFAAFDPWHLKYSPFKKMNDVFFYWNECSNYFNELLELRKKELYIGETEKGTMDLLGPMIKASEEAPLDLKPSDPNGARLSKDEIIGNSFIFLFAGHETSANSIHFSIVQLAISLLDQRKMQADIDSIVGSKPAAEWSYQRDMPRLYNSMVGAVLNEELRIIPAIPAVGKHANGDHLVHMDGRQFVIPEHTMVHLNVVGTNRNPRYWPTVPSKISGKAHDMDDFVPARWLPANRSAESEKEKPETETAPVDGLESASFESSSSTSLVKPPKGAFISFSEGARACPGRRFAQVEITAVLAAIFQKYSVELDVSQWASDEDVARMNIAEKRRLYHTAMDNARAVVRRFEQNITIRLKKGDKLPIRFVERGSERFAGLFS